MSIVVEDGTGLATAVSYLSATNADLFHSARLNFAWSGDIVTKEAALVRATDYLSAFYRTRWQGSRVTPQQALDWPRIGVVLADVNNFVNDIGFYGNVQSNVIPTEVKQACALLALKAIQYDGDGNPFDLAPDLQRETISEKVGTLEVHYRPGGTQFVRYRAIDHLLEPYLSGGISGVRLVRA